jgi:hypothetical protein
MVVAGDTTLVVGSLKELATVGYKWEAKYSTTLMAENPKGLATVVHKVEYQVCHYSRG